MHKRGLHRVVRVYTCQNATLLEITCHGSYMGTTYHKLPLNKSELVLSEKTVTVVPHNKR